MPELRLASGRPAEMVSSVPAELPALEAWLPQFWSASASSTASRGPITGGAGKRASREHACWQRRIGVRAASRLRPDESASAVASMTKVADAVDYRQVRYRPSMLFSRERDWPTVSHQEIVHRARILVIDDGEFPYLELFKRDGYTIEQWRDVTDLPALEAGSFDLILLDLRGVGRAESRDEGFGLLKHLRATSPAQIVIAYSNSDLSLEYQPFFRDADAVLEQHDLVGFQFLDHAAELVEDRLQLLRRLCEVRSFYVLDMPIAELAVNRDREEGALRAAVHAEYGHDVGQKRNGRISAPARECLPRATDTPVSFLALKRVVTTDTSVSPYT